MDKQNFYDLNFDQLKSFLIEKAEVDEKKAKMRAQQMFNAVYKKNIKNFDELTTFGLELREKIKNLISLKKPKIVDVQTSADGTIKFLIQFDNNRQTETVLIPDKTKTRYTICLSVSTGCHLSCQFCATAQIPKKMVRNLMPSEIVTQIILSKEYIDDWKTTKTVSNIVMMGQGENLLSIPNLSTFIKIVKDKNGLFYGRTRITISSVGLLNKVGEISAIEHVARELDVYLAWSLHSSLNSQRSELMAINKKFSINDLIPELKKYYEITKLPIFIEYIALEDNLSDEHAKALIKIMKKVPSKLNLIEYNPLANRNFKAATKEKIDKLYGKLYGSFIVYITLVWLAYWVLLSSGDSYSGFDGITNIVQHYFTPIVMIIDWLYTEKKRYEWNYYYIWSIYPTLYAISAILNGYLGLEYGYLYGFLDPSNPGGWLMTWSYVVGVYIFYTILAFSFIGINRKYLTNSP